MGRPDAIMTSRIFFYQDPPPPSCGFSRHLASEFAAYNAQATTRVRQATGDSTITAYTFSIPDANPLYVWARQEPLFTSLMTAEEQATVKSLSAAIAEGMVHEGV